MKLSELIKNISSIKKEQDVEIGHIAYNSKKAKKGSLFVAIRGFKQDGHKYLSEAFKNNASAAIVEEIDPSVDIIQIKVDDSRLALAKAASNFYSNPSKDIALIGITGTNGKTTVSYMIESILQSAGYKTGLIGTVECKIGTESQVLEHTTPESLELQKILKKMKDADVKAAVMEVSSHACVLKRINECNFDQVIFTNLTQDHFDFHKNFEDYFLAKKKLFELHMDAKQIINIDDMYGKRLLESNSGASTYGKGDLSDFRVSQIEISGTGSHFKVNYQGKEYKFEIMLGGHFNVYNALAAISSAVSLGIEPEVIQAGLFNLENVPGRFEIIKVRKGFKVIVDYAHTPDGLKNLLKAANQITKGKTITVFGCGGERDKDKRPMMGSIADKLSDVVILTSDNPRKEDAASIIEDIANGQRHRFIKEIDRREAIKAAIEIAKEGDTVVIAGKGHETTQEIDGEKFPFNDINVIREILDLDD